MAQTGDYQHKQETVQRPDVGVQPEFVNKKTTKTYRFDSSLDPSLSWDENKDRELAEWLIRLIQQAATEGEARVFAEPQEWAGGGVQVQSLKAAADLLQSISRPFLNWSGKAERYQLSIPTVPLFVHERHSTKAILDGIKNRRAKGTTLDLFGDSQLDLTDKLSAYEHKGPWANRLILGDSLQVMNSLLEFEGLGGQVQMIYVDPPYGVKFGSNFQPFVRNRDVKHGGDEDMTREPEMVKAYRDTWELGLHSYLTYLRDRLMLAKELLNESGSVFVQISDDNLHHVREVMDEVFGVENFCGAIVMQKTSGLSSPKAAVNVISTICDYIVWYARDYTRLKYNQLYLPKTLTQSDTALLWVEHNGERRRLTPTEKANPGSIPAGARLFRLDPIISQGYSATLSKPVVFEGKSYALAGNHHWKTTPAGMDALGKANRLVDSSGTLRYVRYVDDFPVSPLQNIWDDTGTGQFTETRLYVVQTSTKAIARCILMATSPGDLVLDPTCGSGTTAFAAEQWGRRWITCDTSRVPLALARQRVLTATFPFYELRDPRRGPEGGFVYKQRRNQKGEEVGGLVPHVTLKALANGDTPQNEVIVDRPEISKNVVRVAGPFVVEGTISPAQSIRDDLVDSSPLSARERQPRIEGSIATHLSRMTLLLKQARSLRLLGNRELVLAEIRQLTDSDVLHAEAIEAQGKTKIAVVFGPEDGAISSDVVFEAAREAYFLKYEHLYFFGFAIQAKARELLEERGKLRIACTYVAVTPDVAMSDLLKTTRASEIFSVTGLPDANVIRTGNKNVDGQQLYQIELSGLDTFNPSTMAQESIEGENLPAWMLDTDYDGMSFFATQVFFPKTSAWDNLQKSLRATFNESVWEHLSGTVSEPFALGDRRRVAVKVIDERGNELMRVLDVA
jgi:adenine-specific DNA-methyltransferase